MAKKPQTGNYDALGSIFDFIFQEAEKPVDKRKPIKLTGIAGDSELSGAIAAALQKPAAFMTKATVDEFNKALDFELTAVQLNDFGKVKLTSNSLIDVLKDPGKAVQKQIAKNQAIRSSMRATYVGQFMKDFVAAGWARKYGSIEVQDIVNNNIKISEETKKLKKKRDERQYKYGVERAIGQQRGNREYSRGGGFDAMASRNVELLGRAIFGREAWMNGTALTPDEKKEFLLIASKSLGNEDIVDSIDAFLNKEFGNKASQYSYRLKDSLTLSDGKIKKDIFNSDLYAKLESKNIDGVIESLRNSNDPDAKEKIDVLKKTKILIAKSDLEKKVGSIRKDINNLKSAYKSAKTPEERSRIRRQLRDSKQMLSIVNYEDNFWGKLGKYEGYLNSLNSVYGPLGSNIVASVLTGDFFDVNNNKVWNPIQKRKDGFNFSKNIKLDFYVEANASTGNRVVDKILGRYNEIGTNIYYMTPRSMFNTLFVNGEGYAYQLNKSINKLSPELLKSLGTNNADMWGKMQTLSGKELDTYIEGLLKRARAGAGGKEFLVIEKKLKRLEGLRNSLQRSSSLFRLRMRLTNAIGDKVKLARTSVAKFLMRNAKIRGVFLKTGASKLLGQWIAKGGIDVLMKGLVTAIAGGLGLAVGPIGSAIITALTWVATDLAMKVLAFVLNIFKWVALGVLILIVVLVFGGINALNTYNKRTYSYMNETPGSVVQCALYEEIDIEPGEEDWDENVVIPPRSGESCILGGGGFKCSQGYKEVGSWSHKNSKSKMPVDITYVTYIYAPQFCDSGTCTITRIAKINCVDGKNAGGIVEMDANDGRTTYHFKLLHTQPLANQGEKLSGGQPVAVVMTNLERGKCWGGVHLHLETTQNGSSVDPLELLQSFSCNVPDESSCKRP